MKILQTRLIFHLIVLRLPLNRLLSLKVSSAECVYCKFLLFIYYYIIKQTIAANSSQFTVEVGF